MSLPSFFPSKTDPFLILYKSAHRLFYATDGDIYLKLNYTLAFGSDLCNPTAPLIILIFPHYDFVFVHQAVEEPANVEGEEPVDAGVAPEEQGPMTAVLVPPYRASAMWIAWVFLKSFLASLVPEAPRGIAN